MRPKVLSLNVFRLIKSVSVKRLQSLSHQFILVLLFWLSSSLCFWFSSEQYALPSVSYNIEVRLDTENKTLLGKEILTFRNTSTKGVDTLFFHLYPNAFQSESTTFMKESLFPDRIKNMEEYRGHMEIKIINLCSGYDLTTERIIDQTVMKLPLREGLLPQDTICLELEFVVKLPKLLARMGYSGKNFMIGQWFPKMAVLEENGRWNAHQYHANSEFFADFGNYDVSITLPLEYVVGASGYLQEEITNQDSTKTLLYHAEEVHDFVWVADPDYLTAERRVDQIDLTFLYKPEHGEKVKRIMDAAEFALKYYSSAFGNYHYKKFVMADARVGFGGGAMEYPMFIAISPFELSTNKIKLDELILFHEIAHQWWFGMVGSNEFEEAWLDEGFAVYSQRKALEEKLGPTANLLNLWGVEISEKDIAKLVYLLDSQADIIVKNSWEFRDILSYRANVYYKASFVLETLENLMGEEKMKQLLRTYFQKYKLKHPKTEDFTQLVNEIGGKDFQPFFSQLLFGTGVCDYEVMQIRSLSQKTEGNQQVYDTKVWLKRSGDVIIPVEVLVELENGEKIERAWDGKARWHRLELETESKIKSASIDPENKIVLDININNNSLTTKSQDSAIFKLCSQYLFSMQTFIQWITSF